MLNIFESIEQKVAEKSLKENVLQTEIDRLLEVSLSREIRDWVIISVQEQKNKMLRNELEKSSSDSKDIQANLLKRIKILENDFKRSQAQKNVLLKTQVDSIVKERENIKLEYQKFFNSIKETCTQHQKELDELIEHVNQKTYAYADVRAQNQDLLMTIFELKNKLKTIDKEKNVNTKFDKFETWGTLLCVTPLPKNIAVKAKKVSNTKVNPDRSKPVTSHSIPKNEQSKKTKCECNRVESSNSVRRPKSKDNKSKDRVLKNTNDKRPSIHVRKMSSSVSIDSNKREQCIQIDSKVERALFTAPIATKSNNLRATTVVAKSRLSVAKTSTATNKVIQLVLWIVDSGCSKHMTGNMSLLRNFIEKFMGTVHFGNDHFTTITGYGDYVQGNLTICHLWHRRHSHLNFGTINQFTSKDLVDGLSKFKYDKDHLCSACEQGKSKKASFSSQLVPRIIHHTSIARTPQQNGVVERRNRTLVEAVRTMLIFSKTPEFLWAEAIATACFTQNRSNVYTRKMKPNADIGIFIGYSESSRGFRIYNRQTKKIMKMIHVNFDELAAKASECNNLEPEFNYMNFQDSSEDSQSLPIKTDLDNLFGPL
ncbi:retrovirus-related pol polyprotein from transposon TNT 1-94 [Tanacetum coccineum]